MRFSGILYEEKSFALFSMDIPSTKKGKLVHWNSIIHVKRFTSNLKLLNLLIMGFINNLKSKLQKTFTEATLF